MDLKINKKTLLPLLTHAAAVTDKKSSMPALACVLLTAECNQLRVAGSDLYLGLSGDCEATEVKQTGAIAVNARDLLERVKAMPDGNVQLKTDRDRLVVKSGSRRFELHTLPADDMPSMPDASKASASIMLPAETLATLIRRTSFSISTDETRAHVNSLLLEIDNAEARAVSTDGHRLSTATAVVPDGSLPSMLLPRTAVMRLAALLDDGDVVVGVNGHVAFFTLSGVTFSAKLVDAQFPPYRQVIPREVGRTIEVPRVDLIGAVSAVQLASSKLSNGVKLIIEDGNLNVTAECAEAGNASDSIPIDHSGPALKIGFNGSYLVDALKAAETDRVALGLSGELDPGVVRPVGNDGALFVVMPCRT
jgi:DNA polymerase-3 subunit beta